MNTMSCDDVRDVLPELLGGQLDARSDARVRAHLTDCADCRVELVIAESLSQTRTVVPAGLEDRIRRATAGRRVTFWSRGRMAAAATVAVAVIGGSALFAPYLGTNPVEPVAQVPAAEVPGAGFFGVEDAFVSGASSLTDLTDEELKQLLVELDS